MTKKTRRHGFTIVELVIVIAVIAILAAVLIPTYANLVKKANEATALADAKNAITEMLANMLSTDDASDIVVVSKKGSSAYIYGYSAKEGRIVAYKDNPIDLNMNTTMLAETASYSKFFDIAQGLINDLKTNGALSGSTTSPTGWRDTTELNKEGGIIDQLGFKREEMAIFADVEIVVEKFETHTHSYGPWENISETEGHKRECTAGDDVQTGAHTWTLKTSTATEETYECSVCHATKTVKVIPQGHEHNLVYVEAKAATCTSEGNIAYWECTGTGSCGAKFSDAEGKNQISDVKTAKADHTWGEGKVTTQPTCVADGEKTYTCTVCKVATKTEKIAKLTTHTWGNWTVTTPATCTDEGEEARSCSVCGKTEKQTLEAKGHNYVGEWTVTKAATCTETGEETRTCTKGDDTVTRIIPALGHVQTDTWTVTKEATCTENGEEARICSRCKKAIESKKIEAGHKYDANEICTVCGFVETEKGLTTAIKAASGVSKIKLGADFTLSSALTISKEFTIDLNGHTLSSTAKNTLKLSSRANVTVIDSSTNKNGMIKNEYSGKADATTVDLYSAGTVFTLESGTVQSNAKDDLYTIAIGNSKKTACTVNINGGTVANPEGHVNSRAIVAGKGGMTVNINGGTISGGLYALDAYEGSVSNINGGKLFANAKDGRTDEYGTTYAIHVKGVATINIGSKDATTVPNVKGIKFESSGVNTELPTINLVKGEITSPIYSMEAKYNYNLFKLGIVAGADVTFVDDTAHFFLPAGLEMVQVGSVWKVQASN